MKKYAVIMAGGLGSRFWPRSTEKTPKQFIHLLGEGTMIQNTYDRLKTIFPVNDIYISVNESYADLVREQLPEAPDKNLIIEPFGRNTAPALGLVSATLDSQFDYDDIMLAFPADQIISNLGEFYHSIEIAIQAAYYKEGIVTIGINPTRPETQFGYVQFNEQKSSLGDLFDAGVRYCSTFAEKPDRETAKRFIESGDFVWNSGIFVMKHGVFKDAFMKYLPFYAEQFDILKNHIGSESFDTELETLYMKLNPISMDYGILEKADNVLVVKSSFAWSDLGNWDELFRMTMKDARNNFIEGEVISLNSSNTFISTESRMVGVIGVDDLIVIDSPDALLICKRGQSEQVQELVEYMRKNQIKKFL